MGTDVPEVHGRSGGEVASLRRRARRLTVATATSLAAVAVLAGVVVAQRNDSTPKYSTPRLGNQPTKAEKESAEVLLASLDSQPVDPRKVKLVSTVSTFADCDALIGDLRRVGAEHVGSQGFGAYRGRFDEVGYLANADVEVARSADGFAASDAGSKAAPSGETIGTNVQVAGVDELDHVKAVGDRIYDLDGEGNLRITDAKTLTVLSTLDVTPAPISGSSNGGDDEEGIDFRPEGPTQVTQILVSGTRVVVFGTEAETSAPVEGDPSASRSTATYMTVAFVDAHDAAKPTLTDRVRVEGSLVSARLVDGEVRLVTTSNMADLGFVMPTTAASIPKALEQNRRSVALSRAADWIPDWQRKGSGPEPLVQCDRVHVPDTFAGVAMTSMVTFPAGTGRFEPKATSILAPGDTLYAGLDDVAISSNVWVDPIDRERLDFDDWQTAIHEFTFDGDDAPTYVGSGIVDGSTVGQFAFGEVGESLGVVSSKGTPWDDDSDNAVTLTLFTPDGDGTLARTARIDDLAGGKGQVSAVRFVEGRVLVSTGLDGRQVRVVDVTDPSTPRLAGSVELEGDVGYFHPLPDHKALLVGNRSDTVGSGRNERTRQWVRASLLDVADADAPKVVSTWERPWSADGVSYDHHAFTYWPSRKLAMWGITDTSWYDGGEQAANHAVALGVDGTVSEVALPVANKPNAVPAPCPTVQITDPEIRDMISEDTVVLRCDEPAPKSVDWPRYLCSSVDQATVARYAPDEKGDAAYFLCSPAPQPTVSRVLVVDGRPILLTDQTLEALDPQTFASTAIAYHPSIATYYGPY
ncbi:MAG: beta-propeller domain-containing protein [Acidimicrobiales bacterium]|nr:beta-propeller domain-containing protein [Acidimicrobiales bacterium]